MLIAQDVTQYLNKIGVKYPKKLNSNNNNNANAMQFTKTSSCNCLFDRQGLFFRPRI